MTHAVTPRMRWSLVQLAMATPLAVKLTVPVKVPGAEPLETSTP